MATRRAYYGDLQLPKRLRTCSPKMQRGLVQWHDGVDQEEAVAFATSPNYKRAWDVITFWSAQAPYEPEEFRDEESAIHDAWLDRAERVDPLFVVQDIDLTVQAYVAPLLTTSAAHGLIVGDVVLVRRNGVGLFTYAVLAVVGAANTFQIADGHGIAVGDQVLRVDRYWSGLILQDPPTISLKPDGKNHYEAQAKWTVYGKPAATYRRSAPVLP